MKQILEHAKDICNGYSVSNSGEFVHQVANLEISDDKAMVSFDVVSLFTAIPVKKACEYIRNSMKTQPYT